MGDEHFELSYAGFKEPKPHPGLICALVAAVVWIGLCILFR